ncbi:hypothetical protein AM493_11850 [Flavobacterium akiainvivens]|uniref:Uncharacterized protein n=1 Tax=Flavobacterium akiainvivens TaxID=1202724 RepID=A0A0N0RQS4_9FLAO|nr:hypothetical protein [Flavobacterium akiainvivens]KOS06649.1 hypothetical protein AM493_11850 [Flavobacterium akiainvivens]SFQ70393.1 hypothetical protein SAMN05444144_11610 [Flavobacterium akiainvivens]
MIKLIPRKDITVSKKVIGSELAKIQQAFYDEDALQLYKNDNEEHLYWEKFDHLNSESSAPETFNKILSLNHRDIETFTNTLSEKVLGLLRAIESEKLIVISHLKVDFFGNRDNNFKPLVDAYARLEEIVGNNTYNEAFEVDKESLPDFIAVLFWIIRCDPGVAEYIFLFDEKEQVELFLCKYGNLHLTEFNKEQLTESRLNALGFTIIKGDEFDNFTDDLKIGGRQIEM